MADDDKPKKGDTYRCSECGMGILVTDDCKCEGESAFFACCGKSMEKSGN